MSLPKKYNTILTTDKGLSTCNTERRNLQPLNIAHKYSNSVLFQLRENELKNKENDIKDSFCSKRQRSSKYLKSLKSHIYLTENPCLTDRSIKDTESNISAEYFLTTVENCLKDKEIDYLKERIEEKKREQSQKDKKNIIPYLDVKNRTIKTDRRDSARDYINKTRDIILLKYTTEIKKERAVRLQETYDNEIEKVKETLMIMEESKTLFNDTFFNQLTEYSRFLNNQREQQKMSDNFLIDEISNLRNEITSIENKNKKLENDKAKMVKWLFLQIQVKEKRLTFPSYYKIILEQLKHIVMRKVTADLSPQKFSTKRGSLVMQQQSIDLLKGISYEERERVRKYKYELIYHSPDEFIEEYNKMENKNLILLNEYNKLVIELTKLKDQRKEMREEYLKDAPYYNMTIINKQKELLAIKKITLQLEHDKDYLLYGKEGKKEKFKKKRSVSCTQVRIPEKKIKPNALRIKIQYIYNYLNTIFEESDIHNKYRDKYSKEDISSVKMLCFIERVFGKLVVKYNLLLKGPRALELLAIESKIEKKHKREKTLMLKEEALEREKKRNEMIEESSHKVYFLPNKKLGIDYLHTLNLTKRDNKLSKKDDDLLFEDFMYDLSEKDMKE